MTSRVVGDDVHYLVTIIADLKSNPEDSHEYVSALRELNELFTRYAIRGGARRSRGSRLSRRAGRRSRRSRRRRRATRRKDL